MSLIDYFQLFSYSFVCFIFDFRTLFLRGLCRIKVNIHVALGSDS